LVLALQLCGGLIVSAALLQVAIGLIGQVNSALHKRLIDREKLAAFIAQTDILIKRSQVDRQRTELTWSGKRKFRVVKRRIENLAGDICSFYLEPHDGGALPPFLPGQFLTFELNIPDHPVPVVRCYSLSDSPTVRERYRVSIRRMPLPPKAGPEILGGLSSNFFHECLKEGDVIDVMAPNGGFYLDTQSNRSVVLIAGGIGLTPVLSMFKWLADTGSDRETWFFYAVRNSRDIALRDEIREIVGNNSQFRSVIIYSAPTDQCVAGKDYDCAGFLSVDVLKRYLKTSNYEFYVCGPPPMMESIVKQLTDWGVPEADIHFEAFGPASVKTVKRSDQAADRDGMHVKVEFTRSRKSCVWTRAAGTLLELAEANGVRINSGCRVGNCSTCVTALKTGNVTYLTKPAIKPAHGSALVCIAYPDGDVALDA
jgi:ferredoxin-NADP reductase